MADVDHRATGQDKHGLIHPVDLFVAVLIVVVCGALYYVTTTFEEVSDLFAQDIPPEFFPRLLLWFIVPLALVLPVEHLFYRSEPGRLDKGRRSHIRAITYATIALLIAVVLLLPWLGAYLGLVAICLLLPPLWGERRWYVVLPYALLFPTLVTLLFARVLQVYFEPGIFGLGFR
jgi:putative tricarboxylic transport membrane protein